LIQEQVILEKCFSASHTFLN